MADIVDELRAIAAGAKPADAAAVPPAAATDDFAAQLRGIAEGGAPPPMPAERPPPTQGAAGLLERGVQAAVEPLLSWFGPAAGLPESYGAVPAATHGATLGLGDIARGYASDVIRGATGGPFDFGRGVAEVKAARDRYAAENPVENLAANVIGGLAMPLPAAVGTALRAGEALPNAAARIVAGSATGAGLGAGMGAVSGAADEFAGDFSPAARQRMLEGAGQGALFGGAIGGVLPPAITGGAAAWRQLRPGFQRAETTAGRPLVGTTGEVAPEGVTGDVADLLRGKLATFDADAAANVAAAQRNADQALAGLGPRLTVEDRGAMLRDQLAGAKQVSRANESRLWQAVDPDGKLTIDLADVSAAAKGIRRQLSPNARAPEGEEKAIFDLAELGGTAVPFRDMTALRGRLLQAIRDERMAAGDSPALRRMQQLREAFDNTIGTATQRAAEADPALAQRVADVDAGRQPLPATEPGTGQPAAGDDLRAAPGGPGISTLPAGVLRDEGAATGGPANAGGVPGLSQTAGTAAAPRRPQDLVEFLIDRGGLQREQRMYRGDLQAMDADIAHVGQRDPATGRFLQRLTRDDPNAMTLDEARELATEFGYLHPDSDINDLLNRLRDNMAGRRVFSTTDSSADDWLAWDRTRRGMEQDARFDESIPFPGQAELDRVRAENALAAQRAANPANWDQAATDRYRAAAGATREGRAIFGSPTVGPVLRQAGPGGFRMADTAVANRLLGSYESAQAAMRAGVEPAAMRGALVDELSRSLGGGPLTQAKLDTFLLRREGALRAVPDLAPDLHNAARAQARVDALHAAQRAGRAEFEKGVAGRLIGGADVVEQVRGILNTRDAASNMMRLRQQLGGNAEAEAGLARAVAEDLAVRFRDPQSGQLLSGGLARFIEQKRGALAAALPPDGMRTLEALAKGLGEGGGDSWLSALIKRGGQLPGTLGGGAIGAGAAGAIASDVVTTGGAATTAAAISYVVGRMRANGLAEGGKLLGEVLVNPELGRALASRATQGNRRVIELGLNRALADPLRRGFQPTRRLSAARP